MAEDIAECFLLIYQHVTSAASHKEFDTRHAMDINITDLLQVIVCGTQEEAVVDVALPGSYLIAFFEEG